MSSTDDVQDLEAQLAGMVISDNTEPEHDRSMPSFAAFCESATFIAEEHNSPIALLNNNFYESQHAKDNFASIRARAQKWAEGAGVTDAVSADVEALLTEHITKFNAQEKPQFERIFIRDGERSFNMPKHRVVLAHVLTYLQAEVLNNDYHQGLSMIVSFLLCFLPTHHVVAMIMHAQKSLLTDVWKSQSVVSATDGYVYKKLLEEHYPAVHTQLVRHHVIPELYTSKYWCAFGIHILPFQSLAVFFDQFWVSEGVLGMFRCMLRVVAMQEEQILTAKGTDTVLELMSLDHKVYSAQYINDLIYGVDADGTPSEAAFTEEQLAARAKVESIVESIRDPVELQRLRTEAYTVNILPRVASAAKDFAKDTTPDCARSECKQPKEEGHYFCLQCKIYLCEDCAYSAWEGHNDDDHDVRMLEDLEDEDLE